MEHKCGDSGIPGAPCSPYPMLSIAEATELVLKETRPLPPTATPIYEALGKVLAEDVNAVEPIPPYPASIKDGYAVLASDGPGEYQVVAEARAGGDAADITLRSGDVAYITTGGPVPTGADAVVQVEDTLPLPDAPNGQRRVRIMRSASTGQDIRPVGHDIAAGDVVLRAGATIGAAEVGLLAAVGRSCVLVHPLPTVAVLSTGDELVDDSSSTTPLGRGQIRDANGPMLSAMAAERGCRVLRLGIASDNRESLTHALSRATAAGAHVLVTSGGVSMGDRDLVKPVLEDKGTVHFGRVLMKPGKPLTFATIDLVKGPTSNDNSSSSKDSDNDNCNSTQQPPQPSRMLVFALPGNPVSTAVCFSLVVGPALRKLAGHHDPTLRRVSARLRQDVRLDPERPEYHRAAVRWEKNDGTGHPGFVAESTGRQVSSRLLSMVLANALLELPQATGMLAAGTRVSAILVGDLRDMKQQRQHQTSSSSSPSSLSSSASAATTVTATGVVQTHSLVQVSMPATAAAATATAAAAPVVRVGVLTVSDTVAQGKGPDRSGPRACEAIAAAAVEFGCAVVVAATAVAPDEEVAIQAVLKAWTEGGAAGTALDLIITTGGTGCAPRDVTPEATRPLLHRLAPGLMHAIMAHSLKITPTAMLSRGVAGMRFSTLIINMPGNPNATSECLDAVMPALPHALRQLRGGKTEKHPRHLPHEQHGHGHGHDDGTAAVPVVQGDKREEGEKKRLACSCEH